MLQSTNTFENFIKVEKISLKGPGVIILTGPSSCGKGEVASVLSKMMSISPDHHLAMGDILRKTIENAQNENYCELLEKRYDISKKNNIFDCVDTTEELTKKVLSYVDGMENYFKKPNMSNFTSQLDWLEYCTMNGLLVPNRWTQEFIAAHIEHTYNLKTEPFILDGYPRRQEAAQHLLNFLERMKIPVIKVLHLSISRQEMIMRAMHRARADDDEKSLLSRYQFYVDSVQPTVDYIKTVLGSSAICLIDANQPVYKEINGKKVFCLTESIANVVASALYALDVPKLIVRDLILNYVENNKK